MWASLGHRLRRALLKQPGDEQVDHPARVVAWVAVHADAQVADGAHESVGIHVGANLARGGGGVEQLSAHGHEAVEKVRVQRLEAGVV